MLPEDYWDTQHLIMDQYHKFTGDVCTKYGLTRMELDIMLFLANNPQFDTTTDIVERRLLTKSHVSASVKSLAERGFLSRSHTPDNRKTIHLSLCPAADPVIADGRAAQDQFFSLLFTGFSDEDRKILRNYFRQIAANVRPCAFPSDEA